VPIRLPSRRHFLARRWRRIFQPYWASVIFTVAVALVALPFNHGAANELRGSIGRWLAIAALTQQLARVKDTNIVDWSLGFEEQFYLVVVVAATLPLASERSRRALLLAVTVAAAAYRLIGVEVSGLFLGHWMEFAVGAAVFGWRRPGWRAFSVSVLVLASVTAVVVRDPASWVSLGAAASFLLLRSFDASLERTRWLAPLRWLGGFSYSLYLIHVPIAGRVVNLFRRHLDGVALVACSLPCAVVASVAAAWAFHRLVERRFMTAAPPGARARAA
jgi:peptidoglycan/LPS O-acetylase OafA/YrhL